MKRHLPDCLLHSGLVLMGIGLVLVLSWDLLLLDEWLPAAWLPRMTFVMRLVMVLAPAASIAGIAWVWMKRRKDPGAHPLRPVLVQLAALVIFLPGFTLILADVGRNRYRPPPMAPFSHEDIRLRLPGGDVLAGSLTLPRSAGNRFPAVVLITGSSPHDRDNASPGESRLGYRPFRQIAHCLSERGIAVLRMDDRGIGQSRGGDIRRMATPERAEDIAFGIDYLRHRPEIDANRIGLLGLSEGVSIAHMIASRDRRIRALVFLSGIGSPGREVLEYQIQQGELGRKQLESLLRDDPNTRFLFQYDPLETVRQVKQPVLILHGTRDRSVRVDDARILARTLEESGNRNVKLCILDGYNHPLLFEDSQGRVVSARIPQLVLSLIQDWLAGHL